MPKLKVKEIPWGIGCRINNTIYLNKHLKEYPELYEAILKHEKEHTSGFHWKDIKLDLKGKYLESVKRDYYLFILKYPKSWINFLPFWVYDKVFVNDPIMWTAWGLILIMLGLIGCKI